MNLFICQTCDAQKVSLIISLHWENSRDYSFDRSWQAAIDMWALPVALFPSIIYSLLPYRFRNLVKKYRIEEAKKRIMDTRYQKYSLESIGLDVGFGDRWAFESAFEQVEKISPMDFKIGSMQ